MLRILMAKPIELTKVSAVPFIVIGAVAATMVENCGESAITTIPQRHQNIKNKTGERLKNKGETRQNKAEKDKAKRATFLLPIFNETYPPIMQERAPMDMIVKVHKGTESEVL